MAYACLSGTTATRPKCSSTTSRRPKFEETFEDARLLARDTYERDGEQRRAFVAATLSGRLLTVVYIHRVAAIRIVTAYPTRGRLRRLYLEGQ